MTAYQRERRKMAERRLLAAELAENRRKREAMAKRERQAREAEAWALKHHLPPDRVFQQRPVVTVSAGFSFPKPQLTAAERALRAEVLADIRQTKAESRPVHRASEPAPPSGPERIVRTSGVVLDVH